MYTRHVIANAYHVTTQVLITGMCYCWCWWRKQTV